MKRNVIILSVFVTLVLIFGFTGCPGQENVSTYTLTYHANGGIGTVPASKMVNRGTNVSVSGQGSLGYTGKFFDGWNTKADGRGTSYSADEKITVIKSIILYAQWITIPYTITYHINNGTGTVPEPQNVDWGDSLTLAAGNGLSRHGFFFGGWNTSSFGTATAYEAGSSFIPTGNSANITLYAMWIAPMIRTGDEYKEVTNNGTVRIHLIPDAQLCARTEEYRLYRSDTQSGTYSVVATVLPDQLVLEDTTVDWMTVGDACYYKVAAVSGGTEAISTNGVRINKANPKVYMRDSSPLHGYCGVRLVDGDEYMEWTGTINSTITTYELLLSSTRSPPPPGNYTLYTGTVSYLSSTLSWTNQGSLVIRAGHEYMINTGLGMVERSFVKSNWTFF
jgi:uncharacterized repeat protein (TIGR02543 family)